MFLCSLVPTGSPWSCGSPCSHSPPWFCGSLGPTGSHWSCGFPGSHVPLWFDIPPGSHGPQWIFLFPWSYCSPWFDTPPVLLVPHDPPDLVESLISLSTMIFDKGVSRLVFNSLCLSIQCTYPVQFIVPATPSKQNNNKADKNAKNEEKQVWNR